MEVVVLCSPLHLLCCLTAWWANFNSLIWQKTTHSAKKSEENWCEGGRNAEAGGGVNNLSHLSPEVFWGAKHTTSCQWKTPEDSPSHPKPQQCTTPLREEVAHAVRMATAVSIMQATLEGLSGTSAARLATTDSSDTYWKKPSSLELVGSIFLGEEKS